MTALHRYTLLMVAALLAALLGGCASTQNQGDVASESCVTYEGAGSGV